MNKQQTLIRFVVFIMLIMTTSSFETSRTHEQKYSGIRAYEEQEKVPYLKIGDGKFVSPHLNKELSYTIYGPEITAQQEGEFVDHLFSCAVILKNLPIERLGQVSDVEVREDLIQKNMLVVEVDYEHNKKAVGQGMYKDFLTLFHIFGGSAHPGAQVHHIKKYYDDIGQSIPSSVLVINNYKINPKPLTYVMPAGFTVTRNLPIDTLVSKKNVEVPLRMDVVHPFRSHKTVPALLEISSGFLRPGSTSKGRLNRNSVFAFTWTMYGYAAAIMDNVPNMRNFPAAYDRAPAVPYGPYFPEKRALRLLRAKKNELQLNGKVIVCGISKSARRAAAAAFINEDVTGMPSHFADYPSAAIKEFRIKINQTGIQYIKDTLNNKLVGEKDKGPYAEQNDRFDGIYFIPHNSGGAMEINRGFVDKNDPAVYTTEEDITEYYQNPATRAALQETARLCKETGITFKSSNPFFEPGLDHNFNMYKIDEMVEFFNSVIGNEEEK